MLTVGASLGPYEITGLLGAGGMGVVFRARDTRLKRDVAVKVLPEAFSADRERVARFQREAELLAALTHQNIASVYRIEVSGEVRALVMELVEGVTLGQRVARAPIPVGEALALARQLAEALDYAHEHGILHRDLKPDNIKITSDGRLKVLDFGLAKALDSSTPDSGVSADNSPTITSPAFTQAGMLLGTAAYMSPEQARGRMVDKRADIWAFGCILFEMLTGRRAFDGETVADVLAAVMTREPDLAALPRLLPTEIVTLIHHCLQKDARRRLRDIGDAVAVLDALPATSSVSQKTTVETRSATTRALPWAAAATGLIAAIAAILVVARNPVVTLGRVVRVQASGRQQCVARHQLWTGGGPLTGWLLACVHSPEGWPDASALARSYFSSVDVQLVCTSASPGSINERFTD